MNKSSDGSSGNDDIKPQQSTQSAPPGRFGRLSKEERVAFVTGVFTILGALIYLFATFGEPFFERVAISFFASPTPTTTPTATATPTATTTPTPTHTPIPTDEPDVAAEDEDVPPPSINPWPEKTTGKVAFVRKGGFYLGDLDETKKELVNPFLISKIDHNFGNPSMAPDGSKIAFYSQYELSEDIYTTDRDGLPSFTNVSRGANYTNISSAWSPDMTKILFTKADSVGPPYGISIANSDGSDPIPLVNARNDENRPTVYISKSPFSPDGQQFVFSFSIAGTHDLWIVNSDGTNASPVTNDPEHNDMQAVWSPDGKMIAFKRDPLMGTNSEIYLLDVSTGISSEPINLTNDTARDQDPTWSPDGKTLLFVSDRTDYWDIFWMKIDGTGVINLTNSIENEDNPRWLP